MKLKRNVSIVLLFSLMLLCYGCTLGQQWSENYARLPGATANDPGIIDGRLETVGQSRRKKGSGDFRTDLGVPSEATVFLPVEKSLYRIVIHSPNLEEFTLMALNSQGEWDKIHEARGNTQKILDIRLRKVVKTTGVKLVVRGTTDDAALKRDNVKGGKNQRGQYVTYVSGPITALAKIAEFELYGYATAE